MTNDDLDRQFNDLRVLIRADMGEMRADLRERIDGVNDRLDTLNGRTGKSEIQIAVLQDRSERAEQAAAAASQAAIASASSAALAQRDAKTSGMAWGAGAGSAVVGTMYAAWKLAQTLFQP